MEKRSRNTQIIERMFDVLRTLYNKNRRKTAKMLCLSFSAQKIVNIENFLNCNFRHSQNSFNTNSWSFFFRENRAPSVLLS